MRFSLPVSLVAAAVVGGGALALPEAAHAGLRLCNFSTEPVVSAAIASYDGSTWVARGWWTISNGECATVVGGDLTNRYYYYRAEGRNGGVWGRHSPFCTLQSRFMIYGANVNCFNGTFKNFTQVDTGEFADYTVRLLD